MPEISEKPIDQFTNLSKIPQGQFPALMGGDQAVAEVVDASTGRPVLTGAVSSSQIVGSQIWSPVGISDQSQVRVVLYGTSAANAGLLAVFSADTPTDEELRSGDLDGRWQFYEGTSGTKYMELRGFVRDVGNNYRLQTSYHARSGETNNPPGAVWAFTNNGVSHSFEVYPNNATDGTTRLKRVDRAREIIQGGSINISLAAAAEGTGTITYPEAFTASPLAVVLTSDDRAFNAATESVSSTQATAAISHIAGTSVTKTVKVYWTAVGPRA